MHTKSLGTACHQIIQTVLARELLELMAMCLLKLEKFNDALVLIKQTMVSNFLQVNGIFCQFSLKNFFYGNS